MLLPTAVSPVTWAVSLVTWAVCHLSPGQCHPSPGPCHLSPGPCHPSPGQCHPVTWAVAVFFYLGLLANSPSSHQFGPHNIARKMSSKGNFRSPKPLKIFLSFLRVPLIGAPLPLCFRGPWRPVPQLTHKILHHQARPFLFFTSIFLGEKFVDALKGFHTLQKPAGFPLQPRDSRLGASTQTDVYCHYGSFLPFLHHGISQFLSWIMSSTL